MLGYAGKTDMADIGCGIGYFSIPAAEIAGPAAIIYALDISAEMLDDVGRRASEAGLSNIRNIRVDEYDLKLGAQSVGFAILSNVLHEIDDKKRYINEISRILKKGGTLAIIEWEKIKVESGPPAEHRISYEDAANILFESGFEGIARLSISKDQYGITAIFENKLYA